jgi:quercetin dioxygenase-like cupin family protein
VPLHTHNTQAVTIVTDHQSFDHHPHVQSGTGDYVLDGLGTTKHIKRGDVVVAQPGQVHGVTCTSSSDDEPLVIISVVSPAEAGFEAIDIVDTMA